MSLFSFYSQDNYAQKNVEKTALHFKEMKEVEVSAGPSLGVEKFFSPVTAALELVFLMFLGYLLFIKENENGIRKLLYVTRYGKRHLFVAKLGANMLGMFVITFVLYGSNFVLLNQQYGLGDLRRSIQSVLAYRSCGSILSVGGFLILGMAVLLYLFIVIMILIDFLCIWGNKTIFSMLLFFLCVLGSLFFYVQIPINSAFSCLKYINPAFCLNVGEVIGKYVNINILGIPVAYPLVLFMSYTLVLVLCFSLALLRFCQPLAEGKKDFSFRKLFRRKRNRAPQYHMSLFYYELFKVRKGGHICLVMFFFLILSVLFSYQGRLLFEDEDEYYYYSYMKQLSGKKTSEKSAYIKQEEKRFEKIKEQQEKLIQEPASLLPDESLRPYQGFQRVKERELYLNENQFDAFVYEGGYIKLMDLKENSDNRILIILAMLLLTFSLCGIFALDEENGWQMLLQTTRFGKKTMMKKKMLTALLVCVCSFGIIYLPQLYMFYRLYGFDGIMEPVGCIQVQSFAWERCPIWGWILLGYGLRFLIIMLYSGIVLFVSNRLKSVFATATVMTLLIMGACIFLV
jgi:hypothetical protein